MIENYNLYYILFNYFHKKLIKLIYSKFLDFKNNFYNYFLIYANYT